MILTRRLFIGPLFIILLSSLGAQEEISDPASEELPSISPTFFFIENIMDIPIRNQGFQVFLGISYTNEDLTGKLQTLRIRPSLYLNKLSIALDVRLRANINFSLNPSFTFATEDWIPTSLEEGLDKYLPLLSVQYGEPGENLYARLGPLQNITLGNGFLMRNYANDPYYMQKVGLGFRVDGKAFGFPYLGIEGTWGDIAYQDLVAIRGFVRPLAFLPSIFSQTEVGGVFALDRSRRLLELVNSTFLLPAMMKLIIGADIRIPVLYRKDKIVLFITSDYLWQQNNAHATSFGLQTRLWSFLTLHFQGQYLLNNAYTPYFHRNSSFESSELSRLSNESSVSLTSPQYSSLVAWEGGIKFSFFDEGMSLEFISGGPMLPSGISTRGWDLGGQLIIKSGKVDILSGLALSFFYEKNNITAGTDFSSLSNSYLGGKLGIRVNNLLLELYGELTPSLSEEAYSTRIGIQGGLIL